MAGQALYPTTLLLLTMASTGNCLEHEKQLFAYVNHLINDQWLFLVVSKYYFIPK